MEYSDGSESVEVGDHLTAGGESLGSATYDADGDGIADSVIIGQEGQTVMFTDTDGDGDVDTRTSFDSEGNEIGSNGEAIGSGDPDPGETRTAGGDTGDTGETTTTGTETGTAGGTGADPGTESGSDTGVDGGVDSLVVVNPEGQSVEVGEPTHDMNGDGVPDTAVVKNDDGSVTGYTDVNGDGVADQATVIGTAGDVHIYTADNGGGWTLVSTGHLDAEGNYVEDDTAGQSAGQANGTDTTVGSGTDGITTTSGSGPDAGGVEGSGTDGTEGGVDTGSSGEITYTDGNGRNYELGEPTADLDGDGTPETVVNRLDDGTVVGYTDADGDGRVDQVIQIDPDGRVTIGVPDGSGGWEAAATGTIGANGEFVPSH